MKCSKPLEIMEKPTLLITLKDDSGKLVHGASVRLYKNITDSGITRMTDATGVVIFSALDTTLYYWLAKKGCKTNGLSQVTLNRPLLPGVVLYGYSVLTETGVLKIVNSSPENYKISDSLMTVTVNKDTPYVAYHKVGSYIIQIQKPGTPALKKDTLIMIRCGDTSLLSLPY